MVAISFWFMLMMLIYWAAVAYPGILFEGWGFNKISWGQREHGSGDGSPQVRCSGGSCTRNFISYSNIFLIFDTLRLFMMTTNLFVIANVKKLRTGGSSRILLPFFRTSWGVGVLNSAIFNSFHNRVAFGMILEGLRNFGWGGVEPLKPPFPPSVRHYWAEAYVLYRRAQKL